MIQTNNPESSQIDPELLAQNKNMEERRRQEDILKILVCPLKETLFSKEMVCSLGKILCPSRNSLYKCCCFQETRNILVIIIHVNNYYMQNIKKKKWGEANVISIVFAHSNFVSSTCMFLQLFLHPKTKTLIHKKLLINSTLCTPTDSSNS